MKTYSPSDIKMDKARERGHYLSTGDVLSYMNLSIGKFRNLREHLEPIKNKKGKSKIFTFDDLLGIELVLRLIKRGCHLTYLEDISIDLFNLCKLSEHTLSNVVTFNEMNMNINVYSFDEFNNLSDLERQIADPIYLSTLSEIVFNKISGRLVSRANQVTKKAPFINKVRSVGSPVPRPAA